MAPSKSPLNELAPSPIDESPAGSHDDYFPMPPPANAPRTSNASTFLGLRDSTISRYLRTAQKFSSYSFAVFASFHITNTALVPLLLDSHTFPKESNRLLLLTRPYYQSWPIAEPLLVIAPLAIHVISGLLLRLHRRRLLLKHYAPEDREERKRVPFPAVSSISALGFASVPLVLLHSFVTRGIPLKADGSSSGIGLDFVGHGVALSPYGVASLFYALLVAVVGTHATWGVARWLGLDARGAQVLNEDRTERILKAKRRWWGINGATGALIAVWIAGGVGVVCRGGRVAGWVGKQYDEIYRHLPFISSIGKLA